MSSQDLKIATPITVQERLARLERLRESMQTCRLDGVLLTPGSNLRYWTGLTWGETERLVCALITPNTVTFICPKFEDTALIGGLLVSIDEVIYWQEHEDPYQVAVALLKKSKCRQIGLDANCSFGHAVRLQEAAADIKVNSAQMCLAPLRICKTQAELALLTSAGFVRLTTCFSLDVMIFA